MSTLPPSTVEDIALISKLNQRYVREWLGAMVTSQLIEFDATTNKYSLSNDKAKYLTRENNIYRYPLQCNGFPFWLQVEDEDLSNASQKVVVFHTPHTIDFMK